LLAVKLAVAKTELAPVKELATLIVTVGDNALTRLKLALDFACSKALGMMTGDPGTEPDTFETKPEDSEKLTDEFEFMPLYETEELACIVPVQGAAATDE
jgi:hypothetical protein